MKAFRSLLATWVSMAFIGLQFTLSLEKSPHSDLAFSRPTNLHFIDRRKLRIKPAIISCISQNASQMKPYETVWMIRPAGWFRSECSSLIMDCLRARPTPSIEIMRVKRPLKTPICFIVWGNEWRVSIRISRWKYDELLLWWGFHRKNIPFQWHGRFAKNRNKEPLCFLMGGLPSWVRISDISKIPSSK